MQAIFRIKGEPKGKGRPRFARQGGFVKTYTPDSTAQYENKVRYSYHQQCGKVKFDKDEMLQVYIVAKYKIPESISNKKRGMMLARKLRPVKKPDADNIIKIVCDALNGVAYKDDAQVVDVQLRKIYAAEPEVEVMICTAGDFMEVDNEQA